MEQTFFQESTWYNAIPLTERIASLHHLKGKTPQLKLNHELAQGRIQRWKSQSPFTTNSCFAQRLARDKITEEEFLYLLGEPMEALKTRFPDVPPWLIELAQAFFAPTDSNAHNLILAPEALAEQKEMGFLSAIAPLMCQGVDRLDAQIQTLIETQSHLPFEPSTVKSLLLKDLQRQLLSMLSRTMVLELNVARLQGLLQGDTPEERFQSFLQRLHQPSIVMPLLQEYPVLGRQLVISIDRWLNFSGEFLQHLCHDWDAICTALSPEVEPGVLVQIKGGMGDTHRGGRAVLIAEFSSGFQVVYKPRSLAVELHFQQLLAWLNQRGNHPPLRTLKIIDRGTYGWAEFVAAASCSDPEEIQRFYQRQGAYLALLYALEATDFHRENLIAAGSDPVLVDLESLFYPHIMELTQTDNLANVIAVRTISYSVCGTGLLPYRFWISAESEGVEISGLGGFNGQLTSREVPYLADVGTDAMRLERQRKQISDSSNRPTLNNAEVNTLDYTEAIVQGFTSVYRLLMQYREQLLADDGPLACFADDEVRFILRATSTYALLLRESFHPDFLGNALERDCFFDRLWMAIEQQPYLEKVIAAEHHDLWQGDIPLFTTRPNSQSLWSSTKEEIADFFDQTGMTQVKLRLQKLSEADLNQQLWFIRAALTTLAMVDEQAKWPSYRPSTTAKPASGEQLLRAAQAVGDRLEQLALQGEEDASWIGLTLIGQKHWTLSPLTLNLYDGLPGVALFLAYLGNLTNQERYTALARAALTAMEGQLERSKQFLKSIGGFNGWGGVIYALTQLGVLWDEPELLAEAESLVELLPPLMKRTNDWILSVDGQVFSERRSPPKNLTFKEY